MGLVFLHNRVSKWVSTRRDTPAAPSRQGTLTELTPKNREFLRAIGFTVKKDNKR